MPKELKPCILYITDEFQIALHLCVWMWVKNKNAFRAAEWFQETKSGPTLRASIGIGSRRANHITGSKEVRFGGQRNGPRTRLRRVGIKSKSGDLHITMR
jgi:hypothetical protein